MEGHELLGGNYAVTRAGATDPAQKSVLSPRGQTLSGNETLGSCSRAHPRSCLPAHTTREAFRNCDLAAAIATAAAEDLGPAGMLPRALGTRGYRRSSGPHGVWRQGDFCLP